MSRYKFIIIPILIALIGIMCIYSSTYRREGEFGRIIYIRQIFWVLLGACAFFIAAQINYRQLWDWSMPLYIGVILLLLLVSTLGVERLGAQRWLKIGGLNFQPSELAKLIVVIFLSRYFSRKSTESVSLSLSRMNIFGAVLVPLFFVGLPVALIMGQPDLGSALMLVFVFIVMLYFAQVKLKYLLWFLGVAILTLPLGWHFLHNYQRERLLVFLNPNIDPLGAGYTIIQSKIAIGAGGLFGKGWLGGTQGQLHFLPESHTDFIFATFAETWGFSAGAVLLLLYYLLIREGINVAERTHDHFGRLLAFGLSVMIGIQVFINIAMTMGIMPVVGVPLPLMSYGGSSLVITFSALGIIYGIGRQRAPF